VLASLNRAAETVWPRMQAMAEGFSVEVLPDIGSTSSELMDRVRLGRTEPTLLVAARQRAGRGRMGKAWSSAPGDGLMFSLALPLAPAQWSGLSLAVGVSLAESLSRPGLDVRLKWPNDLWVEDRKLAGVLVETAHSGAQRSVVVGVGINLQPPRLDDLAAPEGTWTGVPPTGLAPWGDTRDAGAVLADVAPALLRDLLAFEALGFSAFAERFARRDALLDRAVVLSDGLSGTACGVDSQGVLQVLTAQGMVGVHSNEVSVRPAAAQDHPC
jgi:BirA family biotin operon repressor/biotin-[acetyl-CoA-carboxylase] ligase